MSTMGHVLEHPQCVVNDLAGLLAFNVGHKTNTARIMFVRRIVKSICLWCTVRIEQFWLTLKESLGHFDVF